MRASLGINMTGTTAANDRNRKSGKCVTGAGAESEWPTCLDASAAWSLVELNSTRTRPLGLYQATLASTANTAASRHNNAPNAEIRQCRRHCLPYIFRVYHPPECKTHLGGWSVCSIEGLAAKSPPVQLMRLMNGLKPIPFSGAESLSVPAAGC